MKRVSPDVIVYRFNIKKEARLVILRKRNFASERQEVINEKVNKLLNAKFINEVMYLDWQANVMLVSKSNKK